MADIKKTAGKASEFGAVAGGASLLALQTGEIIDIYLLSKGVPVKSGFGLLFVSTALPFVYKWATNWLKHRRG
jgi:hypothetical protein